LNKKSTSGEDQIHNLMLQNSSQEFRKIILYLINQSVKQAKYLKTGKPQWSAWFQKSKKTAAIQEIIDLSV